MSERNLGQTVWMQEPDKILPTELLNPNLTFKSPDTEQNKKT